LLEEPAIREPGLATPLYVPDRTGQTGHDFAAREDRKGSRLSLHWRCGVSAKRAAASLNAGKYEDVLVSNARPDELNPCLAFY